MSPALLPLLALLIAAEAPPAEPQAEPAPAADAPLPPPAATDAVPLLPAPIDPAPPAAKAEPPRPRLELSNARTLYGVSFGPGRAVIDGLRLTGTSLHLAVDLVPEALRPFDALRLAVTSGWYQTPADLAVQLWRGSVTFLWMAGSIRAGIGGGVSLSTLERVGGGRLANLSPYGRALAGVDLGPAGPIYPFLELEGAGEAGLWEACVRVGLRFEPGGRPEER